MTARITRDIIESYLCCKYKAHLKLTEQRGTRPDYELLLAGSREEVRQKATDRIVSRYSADGVERDIPLTPTALKRGATFLLNVALEDESLSLTFDGLLRVRGASRLGDYHYAPVLFTGGRPVRELQRALLGVYALLLSCLQGRMPDHGIVWYGSEPREARLRLSPDPRKAECLLEQLRAAATPPRLVADRQRIVEHGGSVVRHCNARELSAAAASGRVIR